MVDGGAHDGQPQRHVDRVTEARMFEHRQALVVIHGEHRVEGFKPFGCKQGVGRERTGRIDFLAPHALQRRNDYALFFIAQMPAFTGMRV